jgi:hypothetical protein
MVCIIAILLGADAGFEHGHIGEGEIVIAVVERRPGFDGAVVELDIVAELD